MKKYEAPKLFVDEFVPDTMIASEEPKNGNAGYNQNCWGCKDIAGQPAPNDPTNACLGPGYPFC
ncbi:MAG: hypothetical protein K5881_01860 [Saccharofermentans sp.]|nr:hypothetical protein [Saccharofermentans sp.]